MSPQDRSEPVEPHTSTDTTDRGEEELDPGSGSTQTRSIRLPPPVEPSHRIFQRRPLARRATLAKLSLLGFLVAIVVRLIALIGDISTLQNEAEATLTDAIPLDSQPGLSLLARWGLGVLGVVAAASFMAWLHRVRDNWATQGRPRFSARWSVLMWFVPGFNLWRPPQFMVDLYAERPGMRRIADADAWLIAVWWVGALTGTFGHLAQRIWAATDNADQLNWHYLAVGTYTLLGVSTMAAFAMVRTLTARHDVRSRELANEMRLTLPATQRRLD
ncbi:MAG: DUF4328 domain-containing protein [Acidimicrobiales bacterium]